MSKTLLEMGKSAKEAARILANAGPKKDRALLKIADALENNQKKLLEENQKDLKAALESGKPFLTGLL